MRYALVLWDFDGTLADTLTSGLESYNEVADRCGFARVEDPSLVRDMSMREFLRAHRVPFWRVPFLVRELVARQSQRMPGVRLYPGVVDVLQRLHHLACPVGIVSTNSAENIRLALRANQCEQNVDFIVGSVRLFGKKRALRRVFAQRCVPPQQVLYIGDEVRDIEAGLAAGVHVAAVTWGSNSQALLASRSPTYLVASPAQLLSILQA